MSLNPLPSWEIHDSTKLQTHLECPRKYLFEYVMGWRGEEPNIHLEFGEAWHLAMETLLLHGYSAEAQELAYIRLLQHYRQHFAEFTDDLYYPKTPGFAKDMLKKYCNKYKDDFYQFEVLYTEISGRVSIDSTRFLAFKTDDIIRFIAGPHKGQYSSLEHKTTKTMKGAWRDSWTNKIQIHTYYHVLRCLYDTAAYGIIINGAQFQKTDPNFDRIHMRPSLNQMAQWHWEVTNQLDEIYRDLDIITTWDPDRPTLHAFPRNGEACASYNSKCRYQDFCGIWMNPLRYADNPPEGFAISHWNPLERKTTHMMEL